MHPTKMGILVAMDYVESFPALDASTIYITDEYDQDYNCISWSIGIDDEWHDPGSLAEMIQFYKQRGYTQTVTGAPNATIDLIGNIGNISHAIRKYTGPDIPGMPGGLWESKMSEDLRMTHNRNALIGDRYGQLVASFT